MKRIVSNALALGNSEAPVAAPDTKVHNTDRVPEDGEPFAEKLKDCESKSLTEVKPPGQEGEAEKKDNGMPDSPESMVYGIVGILEGFETPGYQSDSEASIAAAAAVTTAQGLLQQTPEQNVIAMVPAQQGQEQDVLTAAAQQQNTSGLPGQIAWMHSNEEAGSGSAKTQEEILQVVGGYLDSLENTSNASDAKAAGAQTGTEKGKAVPEAVAATPESPEPETNNAKAAGEIDGPGSEEVTERPAAPETRVTGKAEQSGDDQSVNETPQAPNAAQNAWNADAAAEASVHEADSLASKPESVRESVTRIVDRVSTQASEGKYDFDIDLKPDFMGKVSIKLTMEDGAVKVQIRADDVSVKAMLQDQASSLQSLFKEKGIPVTQIEVAYEGSAAAGSEGHAERDEGRNPGGRPLYQQSENGALESARERYDFYFGNSSVEYLV